MKDGDNREVRAAERLESWLDEARCAPRLASRLGAALRWPVECDAAAWSARVALAASALLQERARAIWHRQVRAFLVAAAVALPVAAVLGVVAIRFAYGMLCGILPSAVATYVVASYAFVACAIVGLTYAMIPLVIGRSRDRLAFAQSMAGASSPKTMEALG